MVLSVITVTWNSAKFITEQIKSVALACQGLDYEHIIVDNASTDETVKVIQTGFPQVKLIINKTNLGFGGAYNQAVKNAVGKYFLYLNPDMKILDSIEPLLIYMESNSNVGISSCKLVDGSGVINYNALPRKFPSFFEIMAMFLKIPHFFPRVLDDYLYKDKDWEKINEVDSVRGSFMFIRREIVEKLGWAFDPRYFLWWEDVDLCQEVKKMGYKIIYNPVIKCVDEVGQSFSKRKIIWKQRIFFTSAIKYLLKWKIN